MQANSEEKQLISNYLGAIRKTVPEARLLVAERIDSDYPGVNLYIASKDGAEFSEETRLQLYTSAAEIALAEEKLLCVFVDEDVPDGPLLDLSYLQEARPASVDNVEQAAPAQQKDQKKNWTRKFRLFPLAWLLPVGAFAAGLGFGVGPVGMLVHSIGPPSKEQTESKRLNERLVNVSAKLLDTEKRLADEAAENGRLKVELESVSKAKQKLEKALDGTEIDIPLKQPKNE